MMNAKKLYKKKNENRILMLQRATRQTQDKYKDSRRKANRVIRVKKENI